MFSTETLREIIAFLAVCLLCLIFPFLCAFFTIYGIVELIINRRNFKNINGEVAVVTGAGHGLGRCIALELAKRGCNVAVADINFQGAEETAEIISAQYNVVCRPYKVDVTNSYHVMDLNKQVTRDLGMATILINNAGILTLTNMDKPKFEEVQRMINVNLTSHFLTNSIFLENMKQQRRGHIVAICSIFGYFPLNYNSAYVASKFGVRGMMRTLRLDLQADDFKDIHTTTVCPSFLNTNDEVLHYAQECLLHKFYPLLEGERAARSIVHAMLRNEVEISVPRFFGVLTRLLDFFPAKYQDIIFNFITMPFMTNMKKAVKQSSDVSVKSEK